MKRRKLPVVTAEALGVLEQQMAWVEAEYRAGRLTIGDAEELVRGLSHTFELVVLRDSIMKVGRPRLRGSQSGKRMGSGDGLLGQHMPRAETRGRKRVWPVGFARVVFEAVEQRMARDGLKVSAAVEALLRDTARALSMRESRALLDVGNIRALYYQGRKEAQGTARKDGV